MDLHLWPITSCQELWKTRLLLLLYQRWRLFWLGQVWLHQSLQETCLSSSLNKHFLWHANRSHWCFLLFLRVHLCEVKTVNDTLTILVSARLSSSWSEVSFHVFTLWIELILEERSKPTVSESGWDVSPISRWSTVDFLECLAHRGIIHSGPMMILHFAELITTSRHYRQFKWVWNIHSTDWRIVPLIVSLLSTAEALISPRVRSFCIEDLRSVHRILHVLARFIVFLCPPSEDHHLCGPHIWCAMLTDWRYADVGVCLVRRNLSWCDCSTPCVLAFWRCYSSHVQFAARWCTKGCLGTEVMLQSSRSTNSNNLLASSLGKLVTWFRWFYSYFLFNSAP